MKTCLTLILAAVTLTLTACGHGNSDPVEHKRDFAFFQGMINDSADFGEADKKMNELKVLTSNQKYNMRYALFTNGKVYYEVSNLGSGTGRWSFKDGYLNVYAIRTFFDLDVNVVAADADGDAIAMQFVDRFGANKVAADFHVPAAGAKPLKKVSLPSNPKF